MVNIFSCSKQHDFLLFLWGWGNFWPSYGSISWNHYTTENLSEVTKIISRSLRLLQKLVLSKPVGTVPTEQH
jgi:hypothetical protein